LPSLSHRPQGKQTPLFHRRIFYALAIATRDDALLQTTRQYTWDAAVKYDPEISRLSTLHHLSKVRSFSLSLPLLTA